MTVFMVLLIDRNLYKSISKNQGFLLNGLLSSLSHIFGDKQCHFNFLKRCNSIRIIYYYNHFSWPRHYFCKDTYPYQKLKINHQYVVKTPIFFSRKRAIFWMVFRYLIYSHSVWLHFVSLTFWYDLYLLYRWQKERTKMCIYQDLLKITSR